MVDLKKLLVGLVGCGAGVMACAPCALAQNNKSASLDWDSTFVDRGGARPLHFVADYTDAHGAHRLEEWRTGLTHLRRRTDDRIDLHADVTNAQSVTQGKAYDWQIIDVAKKIDNRISSGQMFRAGMFYSYYSMAHVIARPAGRFRLTALPAEAPVRVGDQTCAWYEVTPDAQPAQSICWSAELGIPLEIREQGSSFKVRTFDRQAIPAAVFAVNPAGLTVRDHDKMAEDD